MGFFGRQIEPPGHSKRFIQAYHMATHEREYGGLFISLDPKTPDFAKYCMFENEDLTQPTFIVVRDSFQII